MRIGNIFFVWENIRFMKCEMIDTLAIRQPEKWLYEIRQKGVESTCYVMVPNANVRFINIQYLIISSSPSCSSSLKFYLLNQFSMFFFPSSFLYQLNLILIAMCTQTQSRWWIKKKLSIESQCFFGTSFVLWNCLFRYTFLLMDTSANWYLCTVYFLDSYFVGYLFVFILELDDYFQLLSINKFMRIL